MRRYEIAQFLGQREKGHASDTPRSAANADLRDIAAACQRLLFSPLMLARDYHYVTTRRARRATGLSVIADALDAAQLASSRRALHAITILAANAIFAACFVRRAAEAMRDYFPDWRDDGFLHR